MGACVDLGESGSSLYSVALRFVLSLSMLLHVCLSNGLPASLNVVDSVRAIPKHILTIQQELCVISEKCILLREAKTPS